MNEQDPELDPQQEQLLRALLADLGSAGAAAEPLPDDVAARLDDTLAGLVASRRPRWMPRLAAGAAAVIVLGLGGVAAVNLGNSGANDDTTAGSGAAGAQSQPEAQPSAPSAGTPGGDTSSSSKLARSLPQLSSAGFAREVTTLVKSRPPRVPLAAEDNGSARTTAPNADSACAGPRITDGASVTQVSFDSKPAALVVHPAQEGKRLVEAWSCDGTRRLASTTVAP